MSHKWVRFSQIVYALISTNTKKIDLLNSEKFLRVEEIAYQNAEKFDPEGFHSGRYTDPRTKRTDPRLFDANGDTLYDTDWQDDAFQTALTQNHSISFAGGREQISCGLYFSYSYK